MIDITLEITIKARAVSWEPPDPDPYVGVYGPSVDDWEASWPDGREFSKEDYDMFTEKDVDYILDVLNEDDYPEPDPDAWYDRRKDEGL